MNEELRQSAAHVFVDSTETPQLSSEDQHHLARVLRLRKDEIVSCSDGNGSWVATRWSDGDVFVVGDVQTETRSSVLRTIALAPVKGDKTEMAIEKLVEIGIDRIVILQPLERSVVRWASGKVDQVMDRYRRIGGAAAMQSRRVFLPEIVGPMSLRELGSEGVALCEPGGTAAWTDVHTLVIGPEGGFSPEELALSLPRIDLGGTILRAETAAIVGASLMVAHWRR